MENNAFNKGFKQSSESLYQFSLTLLILAISLYFLTQGKRAILQMFITVRALQIIIHLAMNQFVMPANVMIMLEAVVPVISFDLLETFFDWESQDVVEFNFDKHSIIKEEIFNQLVDIGYDSFNSVMLLQTLAVFVILYFLQVLFWAYLYIFVRLSKNRWGGQKLERSLAQRIFFGQLIELYIQGYFEFLISSILTLWMHNKNLLGE